MFRLYVEYVNNRGERISGDHYESNLTEAYAYASMVERMGGRVYSFVDCEM